MRSGRFVVGGGDVVVAVGAAPAPESRPWPLLLAVDHGHLWPRTRSQLEAAIPYGAEAAIPHGAEAAIPHGAEAAIPHGAELDTIDAGGPDISLREAERDGASLHQTES